MTKRKLSWTSIAATLLFAGVLAFIGRSFAAPPGTLPNGEDRARAARVLPAANGADDLATVASNGRYVGGNGVVEPAQPETKVAAQLAGKVEKVLVVEGDRVAAGAPLVVMESAVEAAALAAAKADVATAQATFAKSAHGNRVEDIDAALAEAASAKARAESSANTLRRTEQLASAGAATPDELDRARTAAAADDATYKAAAARAKASSAGSRYEDIAEQKAKLVAAEAHLTQAQATLDRLTIRAPIAGEVLRVKFRDGEFYNPSGSEPLVIMGDTSKLRVRIDVDERDVARVRLGASGYVLADAWKDRKFAGKVVEIGRRFGRNNARTDDPVERIDTKILEVVLELDDARPLIPGQRVMSYVGG